LLDDWDKKKLISGLEKAQTLLGSSEYEELKENCRQATQKELSWEIQMEKWSKRFNVKGW
jgi:hypothetical protein